MNKAKIMSVLEEVSRFSKCATLYLARIEAENKLPEGQRCYTYKEGGALRRASLDLSRALSELRKY